MMSKMPAHTHSPGEGLSIPFCCSYSSLRLINWVCSYLGPAVQIPFQEISRNYWFMHKILVITFLLKYLKLFLSYSQAGCVEPAGGRGEEKNTSVVALNLFNHWCHSPQRNREGPQEEKKNAGRAFGEHVDLGVSWGGGWRSRRDPWDSRTDSKVDPQGAAWKTNSTSDFPTFGRRITGRRILLVHGDQVQLYKYKQKHNGNKCCRKQPSSRDVAKIFCSLLCSSVLCCVTETNASLKYVSEDSVLIKDCVTPELEVDQQQP